MAGNPKQKLKLLYLADILHSDTDENTPLSAAELCERLERYGISAGRKSIYSDIRYLQEYGMDIISTRTPKRGFFLAARQFELPEVQLLISAVQAARFITPKKSACLIQKLQGLASANQMRQLQSRFFPEYSVKSRNEEIYYCIDEIGAAIRNERKIRLQYLCRRIEQGQVCPVYETDVLVSPYALIWQDDHYYLACRREGEAALSHLRLDRMKKVQVTAEAVHPFTELCGGGFDAVEYYKQIFHMLGGKLRTVELRCKNHLIEPVLDRFGMDLPILSGGRDSFIIKIKAVVGEGMISWLLQFGTDIEVLGPQDLRRTMTSRVRALGEIYGRPPLGYRFL